ncbi:MAG: transglutaminase-like domain-containing protein [Oceanococcus sp.]
MPNTVLANSADDFLAESDFLDFRHPNVQRFAQQHATADGALESAVHLYYAVRDGFRYDPYQIELTVPGLRASSVLEKGYGWCVSKAVLLAAACRAVGIPARLGYADVRNHLSTARMRSTLKTDVFFYHGYTDIWLEGQWRKATPAFNIELCDKFGLHPLDFDGRSDSIYHPYDKAGQRHMEYVHFRGAFADVPLAAMQDTFDREYPGLFQAMQGADFAADVGQETGN